MKKYILYFALNLTGRTPEEEEREAISLIMQYFNAGTLTPGYGIWKGYIERSYKFELLTADEPDPIKYEFSGIAESLKVIYKQNSAILTIEDVPYLTEL